MTTTPIGPRQERGAALVAVLFVLLLSELAILLVTSEVTHLARRIVLDRDRAAAARLAESGIEHAFAALAAEPLLPRAVSGQLAEGRYEVAIRPVGGDRVVLVSAGTTISGRRVTIELLAARSGTVLTPLARNWRHEVGG